MLQHGLGADGSQADALYRGPRRLICLDCRHHGDTESPRDAGGLGFARFANDVAALLDHLEMSRASLAGISMGAGVVLRVAADHPERVRDLTLIRPAWQEASWPEHLRVFGAIARMLRERGSDDGRTAFRQTAEYRAVAARSIYAAKSLLAQFDRPRAAERADVLEALPGDYPLRGLTWDASLAPPTTVVGTDRDPIHPLSVASAIVARLPGARLMEVTPRGDDPDRHALEVTQILDAMATDVGGAASLSGTAAAQRLLDGAE